jgi:hypothetical protein
MREAMARTNATTEEARVADAAGVAVAWALVNSDETEVEKLLEKLLEAYGPCLVRTRPARRVGHSNLVE